jgi:hypothetical protein
MATYTDSLGFDKGSTGFHVAGLNKISRVEVVLDFAKITAARAAASATALANGDIIEAIPLPAKCLVMAVGLDVTTAEGGTLTIDVGDGSDTDGFLDGVNANTVASYQSGNNLTVTAGTPNAVAGTPYAYALGKYYSAADTIDVVIVNAADVAVMRLWALVVDCS